MKRATGRTDSPQAQNRVSIQLTLGGHSFSAESLRAAAEKLAQAGGKAPVGVEVLTEKTQLVPREEFAAETAGAYLRVAGTGCGAHEIPVWSDPARPVVAVMAADAEAVGMLREKFGGRLRFVSPLLSEPALPPRATWFSLRGELLYIKVYDGGLQFAEVVPCTGGEDFRFLLERLSAAFPLADFAAGISGDAGPEPVKALKRYFKKIVCA